MHGIARQKCVAAQRCALIRKEPASDRTRGDQFYHWPMRSGIYIKTRIRPVPTNRPPLNWLVKRALPSFRRNVHLFERLLISRFEDHVIKRGVRKVVYFEFIKRLQIFTTIFR